MQRNSKARRRWVPAGLACLALLSTATVVGLRFPQPFLAVNDCGRGTERGGDCIVILGGENWTRVPRAIALYRSNAAPRLLITGTGDAQDNLRMLLKAGVPGSVILLETNATSTAENARFTIPILRQRGLTNILLVTSWYHSRRTLNCFQHYGPDLHYTSCPTTPNASLSAFQSFSFSAFLQGWPNKYERQRILLEYAKLLWYWPRHGIAPWGGGEGGDLRPET
jgi:uncharacterized SAM-binding protein YcdF (DUF218 family)